MREGEARGSAVSSAGGTVGDRPCYRARLSMDPTHMTSLPPDSRADVPFRVSVGLSAHLGIEFVELTRARVVATMPVNEHTRQPFGILHGGASVALAETVASVAATLNVDLATHRTV